MQAIDDKWIEPLLYGGIFLGSGGGGKTKVMALLLQELLADKGAVGLIQVEDLEPEGVYAAVAIMGSPELAEENLPAGHEGVRALEQLKGLTGKEFLALVTVEGAGVNILYPLLVARRTGLPLVDADAMGRAFPELQMTTFHFAQLTGTPLVLIDSRGREHIFSEEDNFLLELNTRQVVGEGGGVGFFAGFPTTGSVLRRILIPRTISFAAELGQVFINPGSYSHLLEHLVVITKNSLYGSAIELFIGFVQDIGKIETLKWRTITLRGSGPYTDEEFKILIQNENLIAYRNNRVAAMVPDLISLIDLETLKPINNNDVSPGMEVAVIGMPAPAQLKTKKALNVVGPQCFGYKSGYEPLEKLYFSYYY
ncbi:DUF917 domain-containing protein [Desulfofundulus thermocisternus]|jgi:DUF917 family protein|uniref:DUF917 domain-containing protein n=1 Tax=Desulfofundulus thermocisternus TaxID=42471 RepID=UPI000482A48C|nr:DUF917 domain-containing protein [Desulfofundulus thermocisternus]